MYTFEHEIQVKTQIIPLHLFFFFDLIHINPRLRPIIFSIPFPISP